MSNVKRSISARNFQGWSRKIKQLKLNLGPRRQNRKFKNCHIVEKLSTLLSVKINNFLSDN